MDNIYVCAKRKDKKDIEKNEKSKRKKGKMKKKPGRGRPLMWVLFSFGGSDDEEDSEDEEEERYYLNIFVILLFVYLYLMNCAFHFHYHPIRDTFYSDEDKLYYYKKRYAYAFGGLAIILAVNLVIFFFLKYAKMFPISLILLGVTMYGAIIMSWGLGFISTLFIVINIYLCGVIFILTIFEMWNALVRPLEFNYIKWKILYPIGGAMLLLCIIMLCVKKHEVRHIFVHEKVYRYYSVIEMFFLPVGTAIVIFSFLVELQLIDYNMIPSNHNDFPITTILLLSSFVNLPMYLIKIFKGGDEEE